MNANEKSGAFNISNFTVEEQKRMLELLNNDKKAKDRTRRYTAKTQIMLKKAKEMGIVVSDEEIDEYLKSHKS